MDRETLIRHLLNDQDYIPDAVNDDHDDDHDDHIAGDALAVQALWGMLDYDYDYDDSSQPPLQQFRSPSPLVLEPGAAGAANDDIHADESPTAFLQDEYIDEPPSPRTPRNQGVKRRTVESIDASRKQRRTEFGTSTNYTDNTDSFQDIFQEDLRAWFFAKNPPAPPRMSLDQTSTSTGFSPVPPPPLPFPVI